MADGSGSQVNIAVQDGGHGDVGAEDGGHTANIKNILNVKHSKEALDTSSYVTSSLGTDPNQPNVIIQTLNNLKLKFSKHELTSFG